MCADGRLKYVKVTPYNSKRLKQNQKGEPVPEEQRVKFEPVSVWFEDRWTLVRRMAGDELTQKFFYKFASVKVTITNQFLSTIPKPYFISNSSVTKQGVENRVS